MCEYQHVLTNRIHVKGTLKYFKKVDFSLTHSWGRHGNSHRKGSVAYLYVIVSSQHRLHDVVRRHGSFGTYQSHFHSFSRIFQNWSQFLFRFLVVSEILFIEIFHGNCSVFSVCVCDNCGACAYKWWKCFSFCGKKVKVRFYKPLL